MGLTDNTYLRSLCKLYRGERENPYNHLEKTGDEWVLEYLKFHIWDAEVSVVTGFTDWCECWESCNQNNNLSEADKAEEVYKYAIMGKLRKMERDDINFQEMYNALQPIKASEDLSYYTWYKGEKENPYTSDIERPLAATLWMYERDFHISYLEKNDHSTSLADAYKVWKEGFINDYLPGKSPNPYGDSTNWNVVFQTGKR